MNRLVLELSRAGSGGIAALCLAQAISFSTDGRQHELLSYMGFYGIGGIALCVCIASWVAINRQGGGAESGGQASAQASQTGEASISGNIIQGSTVSMSVAQAPAIEEGNRFKRAIGDTETELDAISGRLEEAKERGYYPLRFGLPALHFQALSDQLADRDLWTERKALSDLYNRFDHLNHQVAEREWDDAPIPDREAAPVIEEDRIDELVAATTSVVEQLNRLRQRFRGGAPTRFQTWDDLRRRYATYEDLKQSGQTYADIAETRVPLHRDVEREIVAMIDEIRTDAFTNVEWLTYIEWLERSSQFLEKVLGPGERERFRGEAHEASIEENVRLHIARLRGLLERLDSVDIQVTGAALAQATEVRQRVGSGNLDDLRQTTPEISFGKAEIPTRSRPLTLRIGEGEPRVLMGRIIQVPVVNALGAGEARSVHARLHFMPDDPHRSFAPKYPAQGEWSENDVPEAEIDLPGNGRPRLLDVVAILDGEYPHAYEWTSRSRAAGLNGYAIKAGLFEVEIEVMASGPAALRVSDRLRIECRPKHMLIADWLSASGATNWVPWNYR